MTAALLTLDGAAAVALLALYWHACGRPHRPTE